jgi:hypothetical protein
MKGYDRVVVVVSVMHGLWILGGGGFLVAAAGGVVAGKLLYLQLLNNFNVRNMYDHNFFDL